MGHPFLFDRYFRNCTALMVSLHTTTLLRQPPKNRVSEVRYSNRKRCETCFARRDTIWGIRGATYEYAHQRRFQIVYLLII